MDALERIGQIIDEEFGWVKDVVWRTREGLELRVEEMTDDHVLNAYRLHCEKIWYFHVEGLTYEPSMDRMHKRHLPRCVAIARMLRIELYRRGLRPKTPRVPILPNLARGRVGRD